MNELLLRRKSKVIVTKGNVVEPDERYVVTILKNVEALGYTFSQELYETLLTLEKEDLNKFYLEVVPVLKNLVGADVEYNPMYPNFPESVMERDEVELYINAIIHYWSMGTLLPYEEKKERLPLFDVTKVKVIDLGSEEDVKEIFFNICQSKTSVSKTDREDLEKIFKNMDVEFPDEIPLKENVAFIGKLYLECSPFAKAKDIQKYFKTATDVLRLITAISNGDMSLAENTQYKKFTRKERRIFMELLQGCGKIEEDMLRYKNRWIRIGEIIHPASYNEKKFKKVITAFGKLRNNEKIETFAGNVSKAFDEKDYEKALELLVTRPGELARKLDLLLRSSENYLLVVNAFKNVAVNVSTPVLLQVREHFAQRCEDIKSRIFFPKGTVAKSYCVANKLPEIEKKYCDAIVRFCENALVYRYMEKDFLGNVYVSEELKRFTVPFSQRSASKAMKTISRGSRIPFADNTNAVRAFIWWTNMDETSFSKHSWDSDGDGIVDIDLSAAVFNEGWQYMDHISYTRLGSSKYNAYLSGDIVNGGPVSGNGASEFLDIDIDAVVNNGGRYVVFQVYSFNEQNFADIPRVMFGWMGREDVNSGEIYEPTTVEQRMDLAAKSTIAVPVIFDCVNREFIWCDMNVSIDREKTRYTGNNVETNLVGISAVGYNLTNVKKPNLYDLVQLHIRARGLEVANKEDADVVFDLEDGITPYDLDVFMGQYL